MAHHRRYSEDVKDIILEAVTEKEGKNSLKRGLIKSLTCNANAPHRQTIWNWRKKRRLGSDGSIQKKKMGQPNKLTIDEYMILGGKLISRVKHKKKVTMAFVRQFVLESFGVKISNAWTSTTMKKLGFSSRRTREDLAHADEADIKEMRVWLRDTRKFIKDNKITPERIVCMDQISFWDNGVTPRSFAPIGG